MNRAPEVGDVIRFEKSNVDLLVVGVDEIIKTNYCRGFPGEYRTTTFDTIRVADIGKENPRVSTYKLPGGYVPIGIEVDPSTITFVKQYKKVKKQTVVTYEVK